MVYFHIRKQLFLHCNDISKLYCFLLYYLMNGRASKTFKILQTPNVWTEVYILFLSKFHLNAILINYLVNFLIMRSITVCVCVTGHPVNSSHHVRPASRPAAAPRLQWRAATATRPSAPSDPDRCPPTWTTWRSVLRFDTSGCDEGVKDLDWKPVI